MKILLIHTFYRQCGGEDNVFRQEVSLLKLAGYKVEILEFHNKQRFEGLLQFLFSIWNFHSAIKIVKKYKSFKPDVVHIHNLHFAIGPFVLRKLKKLGIPLVVTLHNYRLICPSATLYFNGSLYLNSLNSFFPWDAVFNRVYRNSFLQTFWLSFVNYFHRRLSTWQNVDAYIALTPFAKDLFLISNLGFKENQIYVKSNFVSATPSSVCFRSNHFLFVGRLSEEKGIGMLLESFVETGFELHIAGDGPLQDIVLSAASINSNIKYLGRLEPVEIEKEMRECTALIFPSIWYEGMPMTIIEAFSFGTPVIANKLGAMESMIVHGINGFHFDGTVKSLTSILSQWNSLSGREKLEFENSARVSYGKNYTPDSNLDELVSIYKTVINEQSKESN